MLVYASFVRVSLFALLIFIVFLLPALLLNTIFLYRALLQMSASDNASDAEEDFGDVFFSNINRDSLRIVGETLDDLFSGRSSKRRFSRAPHQENITLLAQSELFLYTNYYIIPYIEALLEAEPRNLYIWIATLLEFRQITDPDDICHRWSSYRNRNFILTWLLVYVCQFLPVQLLFINLFLSLIAFLFFQDPAERSALIHSMIAEFLDSVESDIESMVVSQESGWAFQRYILCSYMCILINIF